MNRPRPPPISTSEYPISSAYEVITPLSEESFDHISAFDSSDRFSDIHSINTDSSRPHIETRRPPLTKSHSLPVRPQYQYEGSSSTPSLMSTTDKDFLYYEYRKDGADWSGEATIQEITASQSDIKKRSEAKNKNGSAIQHLRLMGPNRRAHIEKFLHTLNAKESEGVYWEPVHINNTKTRQKDRKLEVRAFEIIFAKRKLKSAIKTGVGITSNLQDKPETKDKAKEKDSSKDKEKEKSKEADKPKKKEKKERGSLAGQPFGVVDDPWSYTNFFDQRGPLGEKGVVNSAEPGLPPFIPVEKPIGTMKPKVVPDVDDGPLAGPFMHGANAEAKVGDDGLVDLDALLAGIASVNNMKGDDDIVKVEGEKRRSRRDAKKGRDGRSRSRTRSRSRSVSRHSRPRRRRPSIIRPRSGSRSRVRFESHYDDPRSDSSQASDDIGFVFETDDELSSFTSEDTFGEPVRKKTHRSDSRRYSSYDTVSSQIPKQYYDHGERVIESGKSRRRYSQLAGISERRHTPEGDQMVAKRRHPKQKTAIVQTISPGVTSQVPPYAEYPGFYEAVEQAMEKEREKEREREREKEREKEELERRFEQYMKERQLREREEELEQRERMLHERRIQADREEDQRRAQAERDDDKARIAQLQRRLEDLRFSSLVPRDPPNHPAIRRAKTTYNHEPRNHLYPGIGEALH